MDTRWQRQDNPAGKLILVTVTFNGRANTKMVSAYPNGRGGWAVPDSVLQRMADELGCQRGQTFSIG